MLRTTESRSRRYGELFGSVSHSEHYSVEPAVMASQIEQLPDLAGYLKYASDPQWHRVRLNAVRQWQERQAGSSQSPHPAPSAPLMNPATRIGTHMNVIERSAMDEHTLKFGLLMESAQAHQRPGGNASGKAQSAYAGSRRRRAGRNTPNARRRAAGRHGGKRARGAGAARHESTP